MADLINSQTGEIVFNENMLLHGVGGLIELLSILEHGIVSAKTAEEKKIAGYRSGGGWNNNGLDYVSLCDPTVASMGPSSYNHFVLGKKISLIVDKNLLEQKPRDIETEWHDEVQVGGVNLEAIIGVMIPESEKEKPISSWFGHNDVYDSRVSQKEDFFESKGKKFDKAGVIKKHSIDIVVGSELSPGKRKQFAGIIARRTAHLLSADMQVPGATGSMYKDPKFIDFLMAHIPEHWIVGFVPQPKEIMREVN
jgi:hypothetical protein